MRIKRPTQPEERDDRSPRRRAPEKPAKRRTKAPVGDTLITCPFCGLGCDDLTAAGGAVDPRGCTKAAAGFARGAAPQQDHAIAGAPASLDDAIAVAAEILQRATAPLFHGLTADLHGIRALLALADRTGGTVDHRSSAALLANAAVARASGWVAATFAEIANRADVVLLVGSDPQRNLPRFYERLVRNPTPLYRTAPPVVAYLGPAALAPPAEAAPLQAVTAGGDLLAGLGVLGAVLNGRPAQPPAPQLTEIAERLKAARYGAIVWETASLPPADAELVVERVAFILRQLNAATRCVGVPLGGAGNGLGAQQAALWQTGWPLRLGFADGTPRHDPWRYDGNRILASGEADALVWVAALTQDPPPAAGIPVIAIVADDVALTAPAAVTIRVGIPGVAHAGAIIRSDMIIALPLQAAVPSDRPSVATVARAILKRLETGA
jgi:formylmethanofuran dehydrogenase subunit B